MASTSGPGPRQSSLDAYVWCGATAAGPLRTLWKRWRTGKDGGQGKMKDRVWCEVAVAGL